MEKKSIICFESETYTAHATSNVDFDTDILRYAYQSMATPASIIDFNMKTREKVTKEQEVLGGFDKDNYIEERVWATAKDGTQVPISMVYKKGSDDGKTHIALCLWFIWSFHGCLFFINKIILTRQRFFYAIAHIRGGEDLGRQWYEGGKLKKKNTFKDFIACSTYLIDQNILLQHICMLKVDLLVDY
jgi:oligopeptidase B